MLFTEAFDLSVKYNVAELFYVYSNSWYSNENKNLVTS